MSAAQNATAASPTRLILAVVVFNLIVYLDIGLPMAVIPVVVHRVLHFNTVLAGFAVSLQYFATFASRASAGNRIDTGGPKPVVLGGLLICVISGLLLFASSLLQASAVLALLVMMASRIALGWSESWTSTAVIVWNIRRVGAMHTAQAISWNGICSYGGIALGATIGEVLSHAPGLWGGLTLIGLLSAVMPMAGWFLARRYQGIAPIPNPAPPMPFLSVFRRVLQHGSALACGSVGFGAISSCLALYFAAYRWDGAAQALFVFGIVFVVVRFVFSRQIGRMGGASVAIVSLIVESLGLLILALFPTPEAATMGAAVVGAGFSLVFPALGVLAVDRAGPENRGAALGAFSVFLDLAIGISGPLLGMIIHFSGYAALFLFSAAVTLIGAGLSAMLRLSARKRG
ncbi:major facilitator superfamily transporter [Neoasaia chiangmaiensis NBRC 101099]|uniref:Uncharacterized MFS-type transporter A0U93_06910 n=1 Tax=Neoasaia chiangmaiensis TaxID=320497 RepID=A0A1U9KPK7_9PROT|nr:MFS transporter [Neoasaia chiangmaiensis]AQS87705.1 MFS transporter [Neoasaia chiangmaiensis]GBR41801.1 major facilitator superfamily transporter [Neoasaia chiangmaiensis NBRC 101099]GEN14294.1 UPF0226 protein [Neoasaia chiangmaiensis]